jgi:4-hydroxybenzoate polyprenyltransferase
MKDILVISLSTIGFILILLNDTLLVACGLIIAILSASLSLIFKRISLVTKVSSLILSSLSALIGISWFIIVKGL